MTPLSENPWIVIFTGFEELNPAARSPSLSPVRRQYLLSFAHLRLQYLPIFISFSCLLSLEVQMWKVTSSGLRLMEYLNICKCITDPTGVCTQAASYLNSMRHCSRTWTNLVAGEKLYKRQITMNRPRILITFPLRWKYIANNVTFFTGDIELRREQSAAA